MSDRRNAVFLQEMGVGPQWRLRNRPAPEYAAPEEQSAAAPAPGVADPLAYASAPAPAPHSATPPAHAAPFAPHAAAPAPHAPAPAPHAAALPSHAAAASTPHAAAAPAPQAAAPAPQATAPAPHSAAAPHAAAPVGHAPYAAPSEPAGTAPTPVRPPAPPARVPGTPSIASTGEDMSWFDDAPTPEYKPQPKKGAASAQPSPAQPVRQAAAPAAAQPGFQAPQARPAAPVPTPPQAQSRPDAMSRYPAPPAQQPPQDEYPSYDNDEVPPAWFDDEATSAAPAVPRVPATAAAAAAQPAEQEIASMDWPALQAAISTCTRCTLCETRQYAIPGRGDENATWLVLDSMPGKEEDAAGYQYAGNPGYLLDNMLKAVQQSTGQGAYLTSLVKCHAERAPSAAELQACRPYLQRELELTQAKVILATGHAAGKGLLGGAARGRIMLHGQTPVVATYHPADLLRKPEDKAKAWQDLCLAKAAHAGRR